MTPAETVREIYPRAYANKNAADQWSIYSKVYRPIMLSGPKRFKTPVDAWHAAAARLA